MNGPLETMKGYARRAAFYRIEYDERRDIPFLLSFIEQGVSEVLEIPCGAGRLTAHLARKAKHVTAVDIEAAMIGSLKEYIEAQGLSQSVTALVGDMTDLELSGKVDLVVIPSEALQLLPGDSAAAAVSTLFGHLKPGGKMIVDVATFSPVASGTPDYYDPSSEGSAWHRQWVRSLTGVGTLARSVRMRREDGSCVFEFQYTVTGQHGAGPLTFVEEMRLFMFDAGWFLAKLPAAAASISFRSSYDDRQSMAGGQRLIVTIQKAAIA